MSSLRHTLARVGAAVALATSGAAFAGGMGMSPGAASSNMDDLQNIAPAVGHSTLSRDDVRMELHALQEAGLYQPVGEASPAPLEAQQHAEAVAELLGDEQVAMNQAGDTIVVLPDNTMVIIEVVPADEPNPGEAIPETAPMR